MLCRVCLILLLVTTLSAFAADVAPIRSPLSPQASLERFALHPGLRIELVASEPEIVDPVAMAFDADGRLWVVEMRDYPNGPAPGTPPMSRIKRLEDRDGDGRYETAGTFADQLLFATGVLPWQDGVIVTLAGEVAFFRDTNGDGQADQRETWFTGFTQENPQLRANHPTLGLDNHIYLANGLRGGKVIAVRPEWSRDARPVDISGMDFRFDPLTGKYEAVSGIGQFGLTFDDFGNRFVCSNRNPCRQIVLEDRYLKRNPFLAVTGVVEDVSPFGEASHVYPISQAWTTSTLHAGQFTAACGVTIYRGTALPAEFHGNSFTCEPTGNLVHRDVLEPNGATFRAQPNEEKTEFLASPDPWFRPVNMANGPDGALYVIDMYRAVIEHPQFMPEELKKRPDLRHGEDRGRIYRIVAANHQRDADAVVHRLSQLTSAALVDLLEHPNSWQREAAARLLLERQDASVRAALIEFVSRAKLPESRVQALWLLRGLGSLPNDTIATTLKDSNPRVREQAVRLAESQLQENESLSQLVVKQATAADARLRFQAALSLGELKESPLKLKALRQIALTGADDVWTRRAVATAVPDDAAPLLSAILADVRQSTEPTAGAVALIEELAELVGSRRQPTEIAAVLSSLGRKSDPSFRLELALVKGLGQGLSRRGQRLQTILPQLPPESRELASSIFQRAGEIASNEQDAPLRLRAIGLLKYSDPKEAVPILERLVRGNVEQAVRLAAIDCLATFSEPEIGSILLEDFAGQTPAVRRAVLDAMLSNEQRTRQLLSEVAAKRIEAREIDPARAARLTKHRNPEIRQEAAKLLASAVPADRQQVLRDYQAALQLKGDPPRGRAVFEKNCVTCHRIGQLGVNVAPDIADSRVKTPAALLTDILDPNRAVDNNFFGYTLITQDGTVLTGIIVSETASSIALKQPEGKLVTVLRSDVEELRSTGLSLMPVGLEKNISVPQMADLISFIKNWRYLDGQVPLGE